MDCTQIQELLSEYLDGELPAGRHRQVDAHVSECPECAAELEALRRTVEAVQQLPVHRAPEDLSERLRRRLEEETVHPPVRRVVSLWPRVAAVAAMFALVVGVTLLLRESGLLIPPPPPRDRLAMKTERETGEPPLADREEAQEDRARQQYRISGEEGGAGPGRPPTGLEEAPEMAHRPDEAPAALRSEEAAAHADALSADKAEAMLERKAVAAPPAEARRRASAAAKPADAPAGPHQILTVRAERRLEAAWRAVRLASAAGLRRAEILLGDDRQIELTLRMQGGRYEDFMADLARTLRNEKTLRNVEATAEDAYFQRLTRLYAAEDPKLRMARGKKGRELRRHKRDERPSAGAMGRATESLRSAPAPAPEAEMAEEEQDLAEPEEQPAPPEEVVLTIRLLPPGR